MGNNNMIKIGGLWKKTTENGTHFSGPFGYAANLLLFKNKYKKSEKDPDLILYIAPKVEKKKEEESKDDDIPF